MKNPARFTLPGSPFPDVPRLAGKPFDPGAMKRDAAWCRDIARRQAETAAKLLPACVPIGECPICGCGDGAPFATIHGYPYIECAGCGHLYCSLVPDPAGLARLYAGTDELSAIQESAYLDPEVYETRVRAIAAPKVGFVVDAVGAGGLWLDVGCGAGEMLRAARDAGFAVRGVESDRIEAGFARANGFDVANAFVTGANAGELCGEADVVSMINVLEHVAEPRPLLAAVVDALRPGARVVLELPRHPSISSFASQAYPSMAWRHIYPPDHLHVFTERSIRELFRGMPLRVLSIWNFGQDLYGLLQAVAAGAGVPEGSFLRDLLAATSGIQPAVDAAGLSDTIVLICEKGGTP